jgi:hypothetical protein
MKGYIESVFAVNSGIVLNEKNAPAFAGAFEETAKVYLRT